MTGIVQLPTRDSQKEKNKRGVCSGKNKMVEANEAAVGLPKSVRVCVKDWIRDMDCLFLGVMTLESHCDNS